MNLLIILGALGGVATFAGSVYVVLRGAFAQAAAIKANTAAVEKLTEQLQVHGEDLDEVRQDVAWLLGQAGQRREGRAARSR